MHYVVERGVRHVPESSWLPIFQRSIDAFYEGRMTEGRDACLMLLAEPGLPEEVRAQTFRNQTFYAQAFSELVPRVQRRELEIPGRADPACRDPSPVWTGDHLLVFVRAQSGIAEILELDDEFQTIDVTTIADKSGDDGELTHIRPFFTDRLRAAVIIDPRDEAEHRLAAVVDAPGDVWTNVRRFGPRAGDFQRGWSPVVAASGGLCVGWWEPTEVFRLDGTGNDAFARVALRMAPHVAERFEGGSQGVPAAGGYLFLINERVSFDDEPPLVFSRFVRLDERFQIDAISPQFFVVDRGRDEASGLARQGNRLVAGFNSGAGQPLLVSLDVADVLATLIPVDAPGRRGAAN